ncbi:Hint domain-containing protein [Jhaorihella thermophila]
MPAYPEQNISVYPADAFCVVAGANLGDGLSGAEDLVLDDLYRLRDDAHRRRLALEPLGDTTFRVARGSETGKPGDLVHLDCAITLMSPDGQSVEALILIEVDDDWLIESVHVLPLARIEPKTDYALVGCDKAAARRRFAQVACVSFTAGTHITMATGKQVPIEDIRAGDRVLTRDAGPQEVRWIGHSTVRAVGDFAPVVIEKKAC